MIGELVRKFVIICDVLYGEGTVYGLCGSETHYCEVWNFAMRHPVSQHGYGTYCNDWTWVTPNKSRHRFAHAGTGSYAILINSPTTTYRSTHIEIPMADVSAAMLSADTSHRWDDRYALSLALHLFIASEIAFLELTTSQKHRAKTRLQQMVQRNFFPPKFRSHSRSSIQQPWCNICTWKHGLR